MALYMNGGSVTKDVPKSTPGNVFAARVTNTNGALRYFQLHDKATAPVGNDVPLLFVPIPVGGVAELDARFLGGGQACANGVAWAISTTAVTFTDAATASEHAVIMRYG